MNILTFDIEDWFHILDNPLTKYDHQWEKFESRLHRNMDLIFDLLDSNNQKATFFCLGWVGEKYPEIIRRISDFGHEVGSHTNRHQLVYEQTKKEFSEDLKISMSTLEGITGKKVVSFRAPGFSIRAENLWALEVLIEQGIEYDSSIFPAPRSHGGINLDGYSQPFLINSRGLTLKEFPINVYSFLSYPIVYSGGGYFRMFPGKIIDGFFANSNYVMTYFHPRDFDPGQPLAPGLSLFRKFKSYYGLDSTFPKLKRLMKSNNFMPLSSSTGLVDWDTAKTLSI